MTIQTSLSENEHEVVVKLPDRETDFINKVNEDHYKLDREYFIKLFETGRLFPHASFEIDDQGIVVNDVFSGSFFHRAGMRKEDIIHKINGNQITSFAELLFFSRDINDMDAIEIEFSRNQQLRYTHYMLESDR